MEHTPTDGRGWASTGVISTGIIAIHRICVGDGDSAASGNSGDADNSIASSSSSSYLGRPTKRTKEEILQQHVVCIKDKSGLKGAREPNTHHENATKVLSQTFGDEKQFVPKNSEGESESTKYTDIQSEYVGNLAKIKLLEACIMAYDMRGTFIVPILVDEYVAARFTQRS